MERFGAPQTHFQPSTDVKIAFDVAERKHVGEVMENVGYTICLLLQQDALSSKQSQLQEPREFTQIQSMHQARQSGSPSVLVDTYLAPREIVTSFVEKNEWAFFWIYMAESYKTSAASW